MEGRKLLRKKQEETIPIDDYIKGLLAGNRICLSKSITLIESEKKNHWEAGQRLLKQIMPYTGKSLRIGITGIPGAGKSTFINRFGKLLLEKGHKVAVLSIDPTSPFSQGSLLGDKTRMEDLANADNAFVRPSPSGGHLGGVHRKTRESILLCEAAGFDVILVETVGVGQSEIDIRSMTDLTILLTITGGGDDLQGMKKGIMETADMILVNKADGENKRAAHRLKRELEQLLHIFQSSQGFWKTKVFVVSSLTGEGVKEVWEEVQAFIHSGKELGEFQKRRQSQLVDWLKGSVKEQLLQSFYSLDDIKKEYVNLEEAVSSGRMPVTEASERLIKLYFSVIKNMDEK